MNRIIAAAALAAVTLTSGAALAQGLQPSGTRAGGPGQLGAPGEITDQHRTYLRTYMGRQTMAPVTMSERVTPGYVVPGTVQLRSFDDDVHGQVPSARRYRYFSTGGSNVVLVDPDTRRVVEVID